MPYVRTMICENGHSEDASYPNSAAFERVMQMKLVACSVCGSTKVTAGLPTTRVNGGASRDPASAMAARLGELREKLMQAEDVGRHFAEVATRMDKGEEPHRDIRGEGTAEDVRQMAKDGVSFGIVPPGFLPKLDS